MEKPKKFEEIVIKAGYLAETHFVATKDGYINEMHRIYKDSEFVDLDGKKVSKPVIIFQHGIMDSSSGWIVN